jgi:hypothetical protein
MEKYRWVVIPFFIIIVVYNFFQFNFLNLSFAIICAIAWGAYIIAIKRQSKRLYQNALQTRDHSAALSAGRRYYANKRMNLFGLNRINSIFDEQAIQNDLNANQ